MKKYFRPFRTLSVFVLLALSLASCQSPEGVFEAVETGTQEENPDVLRNGQRKADLQQMAVALEFYKSDTEAFPLAQEGMCVTSSSSVGEALAVYLSTQPLAPEGTTNSLCPNAYYYISYGDASSYILAAELEIVEGSDLSVQENVYCSVSGPSFFTQTASYEEIQTALEAQKCSVGEGAGVVYYIVSRT